MVTITGSRDGDGYSFRITDGKEELEKSLGRKLGDVVIRISEETMSDLSNLSIDVLEQIRLGFQLEDARGVPWIITNTAGMTVRSHLDR